MQSPWKKSTVSFSATPLKKSRSCQDPAPFLKIWCKVRKAERRVQIIWGVPVPSFLISFCIKAGMRMCWSLSLITFQALQLQYFSIQFSSLHTWQVYINSKIWKELFLKICESNTKYLRLKSPKYKAKLNLQKNYYIRQQNNKIRIIKKQWNNKKYSALPASLPFTFLSSDPKKENFKLHFSALQNI